MKPRVSTVALVAAVIVIAGFFAWQMPIKIKYDESRDQFLREAPTFAVYPLDAEAGAFLESVRDEWNVQDQDCPDSTFSEISSVTGLEESVAGVVELYTHEIPEFSLFNHRRNSEEAVLATTMAVALPISVDNRIYVGDGFCFIKLSENLVETFEDTKEGLSRIRYSKAKSGEQDGAEQPATALESKLE